ncbi:pericentrin isoform X2 [Xenopus laevis]|uniref:Pericentrin isoform X2 n=1 Tax=Xenopus laevis TaxID=8355 RepID=A0A8J0TMS7_XENLA|nr:pericentrin isoform X2 [Xenopus laevis]
MSLEYSSLTLAGYHEMSDVEEGDHMNRETFDIHGEDETETENESHQLQKVVHTSINDCNDMTQLSSNLQQELQGCLQMLEDPAPLSNPIHTMEGQLHDAAKDKEKQVAKLENLMQEKEKKLTFLQEKLEISEKSVFVLKQELSESNVEVVKLQHKLSGFIHPGTLQVEKSSVGMDKEQELASTGEDRFQFLTSVITDLRQKLEHSESLCHDLSKKLRDQMLEFERERVCLEHKHNDIVTNFKLQLQHAEQHAREAAAHDKQEKEHLNEELRTLKDKLRLESESNQTLKMRHDQDVQFYITKLQSLEREQELHEKLAHSSSVELEKESSDMSDKGSKHALKGDYFRHELEDLKKNLNRVKARKDNDNYETALHHLEDHDDGALSPLSDTLDCMDKYLVPSASVESDSQEHAHFELDSDFVLEQSLSSLTEESVNLLSSPMAITNVLAGGASLGTSLDPEYFAVYLSSNLRSPAPYNEFSTMCDESLLQKCAVLVEQLNDKEQQLQECSSALEEALVKWSEVTNELAAAKLELNIEKSKGGDFKKHELIVEELQSERDSLRKKIIALETKSNVQDPNNCGEKLYHDSEILKNPLLTEDNLTQLLVEKKILQSKLSNVEQELEKALEFCNELKTDNAKLNQMLQDVQKSRECDHQEYDNKLNAKGVEQQLLYQTIKEKEAGFHERERSLQEEVCVLKQVKAELENRSQAEVEHQNADFQKSEHHMQMEALRLSLTNMHTAHLELCQTNLQREKEDALVQLREHLNDKRSQDVALLQGRHQFEVEKLKSQHAEAMENLVVQHSQELETMQGEIMQLKEAQSQEILHLQKQYEKKMDGLQEEHSQELEEWKEKMENMHQQELASINETMLNEMLLQHQEDMENLKLQLQNERKHCDELTVQNQNEVSILQSELDQLREEMRKLLQDTDKEKVQNSESDHEKQLIMQLLQEHPEGELDISTANRSNIQIPKQEGGYYEIRSSVDIQLLWSQLDGSRASRQELIELKEQLLARSAQVEEIGRLKQDFEQQRLHIKAEHEKEMEELRIYFEQKSRMTEENYREELEMLLQRLREIKDEDKEELPHQSSSLLALDVASENEQSHLLQQLTDELLQHKEELSYLRHQSEEKNKRDLENLHASLSLQYVSEIQSLQMKHSLEQEQLKARLSEEHLREMTKLGSNTVCDNSHLMGAEVDENMQCFEDDYQAWHFPLPPNHYAVKLDNPLEQSDVVEQLVPEQGDKLQCVLMENKDQICQAETHLMPEDATCSIPNTGNSENGISLQNESCHLLYEKRHDKELLLLKDQHAKELESLKQQMSIELAEITKNIQADYDCALKEAQKRFKQELRENPDELQSLWRELHEKLDSEKYQDGSGDHVSVSPKGSLGQHKELLGNSMSDMQQHENMLIVDVADQKYHLKSEFNADVLHHEPKEKIISQLLEIQKQYGDLRAHVTELQLQNGEELNKTVSEHEQVLSKPISVMKQKYEEELSNVVSQLQLLHTEESPVSELQMQNEQELHRPVFELQHQEDVNNQMSELEHKKELSPLISELQKQHDEEFNNVFGLQRQHQEALNNCVSKLQQQHEEELDGHISDLQQQNEKELSNRVSQLLQQHEEELNNKQMQHEELDNHVSELQDQNEKELCNQVSELQRKHEKELKNKKKQHEEELDHRVYELQLLHEKELNNRVSELQQQHEEEFNKRLSELQQQLEEKLNNRVSDLQREHEEELKNKKMLNEEQLEHRLNELHLLHEKELNNRVSELKQQHEEELNNRVSELQQHQEELNNRVSDLQREHEEELKNKQRQHEEELDNCMLELKQQHAEEFNKHVSELQQQHEEELNNNVSKLQRKHEKELNDKQRQHEEEFVNRVSELQQQHEKVLNNRVSKLQQQHKEQLNNCVSKIQQQHKEELNNCLSEIQQQHEEKLKYQRSEMQQQHELKNGLSELQQQHEEELTRVSNLQKHEEELKALTFRHKTQIEQLETTHMTNMDTLESSYLTEIQKIRDEHSQALADLEICLSDRLQEKEREMLEKLANAEMHWRDQHQQELRLLREILGKELAAVHMDKFQAMSRELEEAHMEELDHQRCVLEQEKIQALDVLQEELQKIEQQHQIALQELQGLHNVEVKKMSLEETGKLQLEIRKLKDEIQKQEILTTELTTERQALSAELQVKADQQLQFQEEIELLKCQSEMLLEQQITQLKEEFEVERRVSLQKKEEQFTKEAEKMQATHQVEMDHMTDKLQEKSKLVLQLQEQISSLTKEMEKSDLQLEELVQRRERENQEGDNLVAMLQSDVSTAQHEKAKLHDSCRRLLKLFSDVLKNTLSTEDLICKKIGLCLDSSLPHQENVDKNDTLEKTWGTFALLKCNDLLERNDKNRSDCETMTEQSLMSSDEGYEVSEYLCESMLGNLEVGLENEEKILLMSQRLRTAVEQLLEMVAGSTTQLEFAQEMQQKIQEKLRSNNLEMAQVVVQNQEMKKQLALEREAKNQLQVELHKAQGLIEGYAAEKATLEKTLSGKENAERLLVVELEKSREQLKVLCQEPSILGEEKAVLLKLQEVLSGSVKNVEAELLKETERLAQEKIDLHCQAKKDQSNLLSQMKVLEMEFEEQMSRNQELLRKTNDMSDLQQQIQSLEKQLKNQRHFMDEQAVEREHERDEFQQEIQKLEEQLKLAFKNQGDSRAYGLLDWRIQIENLEAQVKEKADDCNLLLQGRDHLEQQITERNEEIDKMLIRIQELEQAALSNADAAKKCTQLEEELHKLHKTQKEILQDKDALQKQQYNNALQISALQSKLDEARHRVPLAGESENILLKEQLQAEREALLIKEKEAESLAEQLEQFREDLMNKTEEVLQLNMQLEVQSKQNELVAHEFQEEVFQLKEDLFSLKVQRDQERDNSSLELPQALLQEKNQEIDHLNEQILQLQQELEKLTLQSKSSEVDQLEESLVEHLRSDLERLRKDKEEEVEQLHEVIEKLQQELVQLGPNRHEVSDSQESLDQLGLGEVENLKSELRKGARKLHNGSLTELDQLSKGKEDLRNLEEELMMYKTEIETLQQNLEEIQAQHHAELEVLGQNLHNLQESTRQKVQELNSLELQHTSLQEEHELLRTVLSQRESEVAILSSQVQEIQDTLQENKAFLTEKELLVQTLQEQRTADVAVLEEQFAQKCFSHELAISELQELRTNNEALKELLEKSSKDQEKHREEVDNLNPHLNTWEDKAKEIQAIKSQETEKNQVISVCESDQDLVSLKEQLSTAKEMLMGKETQLHNTQDLLSRMKCELEELHIECEHRETKAQQAIQQLKRRDACVVELQSHSQNLGAQVQKLQKTLESQEVTIASMSEELQKQNMEGRYNVASHIRGYTKPRSFTESLTDLSDWDSPDMVRKQEEHIHSMRVFTPFSELSIAYSTDCDPIPSKSSEYQKQTLQYDLLGSSTPSLTGSNYSAQRTSPVGDTEHIMVESETEDGGTFRNDNIVHEQTDKMFYNEGYETGRKPEMMQGKLAGLGMGYLRKRGMSKNLQSMLQMIHEESCKILALSQRPIDQIPGDPMLADTWQKDKQTLQDAMQTLSKALTEAALKQEKESSDVALDWRKELLQNVQRLLESERAYLRLELQSCLGNHGSVDASSMSETMERLIKEQEEQKHLVMAHLLASDRSSLLSEIQDLRSQLRMAHLQNQEKLQQLQETLTNTEEKGSIREHQLRRQAKLLEYKLQQEASILADLKASLSREKERASEQRQLLLVEQGSVSQLRTEQEEWQLEQEKLLKTQTELQMEISRLREELESKEQTVSVYMEKLHTQQELGSKRLEEEKILQQQSQERYEKTLQELSESLEELQLQNNNLSAALQHEQTCCSNLKKDLQIEQSRAEALLALEQNKLSEMKQELAKERQQSQKVSNTLTLERNMLEQLKQQHSQELSRKDQEKVQEHNAALTLRSQLEGERSRAKDLAAMMEKTQQQAIHAKRQLEAEVQASREETQKVRETSIKLRAMLDSLQSQKQQLDNTLEQLRFRESNLQKERDQYQAQLFIYQEEERCWVKEKEKDRKREQQNEAKKAQEEEREKKILSLQQQHDRDQHRIQELQHMLAELEEQERAIASRKLQFQKESFSPTKIFSDIDTIYTKGLEKVWHQLSQMVLQVREWVIKNIDRKLPSYPDEEAVTSLLDTLSELKTDLKRSCGKPSRQVSHSLMDVLQSENEELTKSVTALAKDKMELKSQLAELKRLQQPSERQVRSSSAVEPVFEAERAAWHRERRHLQIALKHAESELAKVTLENQPVPDVPNSKLHRLHRKYLRAESFRKALVYQKKYLLLLLGGFQACEQATLSLIARMGVYPSPSDLQIPVTEKPALTKFRSAVRAVIAISRLKFLVRKWHKINKKAVLEDPVVQTSAAFKQGPLTRTDILHQQNIGSVLLNSPPTKDVPLCLRPSPVSTSIHSPKTTHWTHNRSGSSPALTPEQPQSTSHDPERSISEYIRHLELVQQRLGGLQNGTSPELSRNKYIRK